ncbi:Apolipoprotein N-acyltransferase [Vibrio crassostreae]|nr:Apolipoprotein N-acyltransferase [Vibrio crassostreae]
MNFINAILSIFLGYLVSKSYSFIHIGPILFLVALSIWFVFIHHIKARGLLLYTLCWSIFGFSLLFSSLLWMVDYIGVYYSQIKYYIIWFFLIVILSLPYFLVPILSYNLNYKYNIILIPSLMSWIEISREYTTDFSTPWLMPSYLFTEVVPSEYYEVWGGSGVSLTIYFFSYCLASIIVTKNKISFKALFVSLLVFFFFTFLLSGKSKDIGSMSVRVINDNYKASEKNNPTSFLDRINNYAQISQEEPITDLTIWPESSYLNLSMVDLGSVPYLKKAMDTGSEVLVGMKTKSEDGISNSILSLSKNEVIYNKRFLIPFEEFVPKWFLFMFSDTYQRTGFETIPGEGLGFVNINQYKGILTICYEVLFSRAYVARGDEYNFIVIMSDLNWNDSVWLEDVMLRIAIVRAMEMNKPVLLSSNGAISSIISKDGVNESIRENNLNYLDGIVKVTEGNTFYYENGNLLNILLCFFLCLWY